MRVKIISTEEGHPAGKLADGELHSDNADGVLAGGADVGISLHGTIVLFHLFTPVAERWVENHVAEDAQWFGDALAVEHRFASDLANGVSADGLRVQVSS